MDEIPDPVKEAEAIVEAAYDQFLMRCLLEAVRQWEIKQQGRGV